MKNKNPFYEPGRNLSSLSPSSSKENVSLILDLVEKMVRFTGLVAIYLLVLFTLSNCFSVLWAGPGAGKATGRNRNWRPDAVLYDILIYFSGILKSIPRKPITPAPKAGGKLLILAFGVFGRPDKTEIGSCPKAPLRHFVYYQKSPISANSRAVGLGAGKWRENDRF